MTIDIYYSISTTKIDLSLWRHNGTNLTHKVVYDPISEPTHVIPITIKSATAKFIYSTTSLTQINQQEYPYMALHTGTRSPPNRR